MSRMSRLRILAWNIWMMPEALPGLSPQNVERARAIGLELLRRDYDVVCLAKAFDRAARSTLLDALGRRYPYHYGPINDGGLLLNGGVWVLSRVELTGYRTIVFRDSVGAECFSNKGAMFLRGEVGGRRFQLVATHLQGDDRTGYVAHKQRVRDRQMRQIVDELIRPYAQLELPLFVCGDMSTPRFTVRWPRVETQPYRNMLALFGAQNGRAFRATLDDCKRRNDLATDDTGLEQEMDYILLRRGERDVFGRWERVVIRKPAWDQQRRHADLSYRYAVEAEFWL
jgi:endonuclease/exonuclease/phosphatase family metal-dependent hydrolase